VPLAGAFLGALPVIAIVAANSVTDPRLFAAGGTPTDPWPSDASTLFAMLMLGVPAAWIIGAGAACASYGIGVVVCRWLGLWWAAVIGGLLTGAVALAATAVFARVSLPPAATAPIVAMIAAACATVLGRLFLAARLRP